MSQPNDPGKSGDNPKRVACLVCNVFVALGLAGGAVLLETAYFPEERRGDTRLVSGEHVVFTFLAPTGPPTSEFVEAVDALRRAVRDSARSAGYQFSTVAISDDWVVKRGLKMLSRFDPFDEVDVGRNAFNLGIRRVVFEQREAPAVPQILISIEEIDRESPDLFVRSRTIARFVGAAEILSWKASPLTIRVPR